MQRRRPAFAFMAVAAAVVMRFSVNGQAEDVEQAEGDRGARDAAEEACR